MATGSCADARTATTPMPSNFPGNTELCDGQDNDCDGVVDNGLPDTDETTFSVTAMATTVHGTDAAVNTGRAMAAGDRRR